jgi:hypothetical protein
LLGDGAGVRCHGSSRPEIERLGTNNRFAA